MPVKAKSISTSKVKKKTTKAKSHSISKTNNTITKPTKLSRPTTSIPYFSREENAALGLQTPYKPTVVIYQDISGEWRWYLVSNNDNVLADSGKSYPTKWGCKRSARKYLGI